MVIKANKRTESGSGSASLLSSTLVRKLFLAAVCLLLLGGGVLALRGAQDDERPAARRAAPSAAADPRLAGSPAALAGLHRQSNELLPGGPAAFEKRLRELRGYPVVVNKWATWCGPCRSEFPVFQKVAVELGKEVAFVGVNATDNAPAAREFLAKFPVSYPSYSDPEHEVAKVFRGNGAFPTTAFYDARGRFKIALQKPYRDAGELRADIEKYAL